MAKVLALSYSSDGHIDAMAANVVAEGGRGAGATDDIKLVRGMKKYRRAVSP